MKTFAVLLLAALALSGCMVVPLAEPAVVVGPARHHQHHGGHHHGGRWQHHRGWR